MRIIKIKLIFLAIILLGFSCRNKAQDASLTFSEAELYNFGLEAPADVYRFFEQSISSVDFKAICEETREFRIISIAITIKNSVVEECAIKTYDYLEKNGKLELKPSSNTESIIKKALFNKKVSFSFIDNQLENYDFRLNVNKFCMD